MSGTQGDPSPPPAKGWGIGKLVRGFVFADSGATGGSSPEPTPPPVEEAEEDSHVPPPRVVSTLGDAGAKVSSPRLSAVSSVDDPEVREMRVGLMQVIAGAGVSGYQRLSALMRAMKSLPEAQRLQAAVEAIAEEGITTAQLLAEIQTAEETLGDYSTSFKTKAERKLADRIAAFKEESEGLDALLEDKDRKLKELKDEIAQLEAQRDEIAGSIDQEKSNSGSVQGKFDAALGGLLSEMRRMKDRLSAARGG
ncbi:MAG: hypothetical protein NTU97_00860 [Candidatus Magasanikbacteria bacterium]|nr:hypothetical protein [Candidatus Magasanikbacteria bacterium]